MAIVFQVESYIRLINTIYQLKILDLLAKKGLSKEILLEKLTFINYTSKTKLEREILVKILINFPLWTANIREIRKREDSLDCFLILIQAERGVHGDNYSKILVYRKISIVLKLFGYSNKELRFVHKFLLI